jgi:hypothetical protein
VSDWTAIPGGFRGDIGSEGGHVRLDEEHGLGARVMLEEGGTTAPWAITCGIYGWMFHTVFFGNETAARDACSSMKARLEEILRMIPRCDDAEAETAMAAVCEAIEKFVADF